MSTDSEIPKWSHIEIGKHVSKLRKANKMTKYKLAICSGISQSVLMRVETGEREPRINTLMRIIEGLDMTPGEFFKPFH